MAKRVGWVLRVVLPAVVIVVWLVAASFGGPTFGKLSEVSTNDQASFLPASAESTEAGEWQQRFSDSDAIPAVVVLSSADGSALDQQTLGELGQLTATLGDVEGVAAEGEEATVAGPIPSEDGVAVEFIVPIADTEHVDDVVAAMRTTLTEAVPSGIDVYVTGPAGLTADLVGAFGGIDGILLLVAVGAVFVILLVVYRAIILPFLVLFTSVFALTAAILLVYAFASWGWITLNGQSQGILSILVIGAATDYSLLLVARYREALHSERSPVAAMKRAWRAAIEPIAASAATVVLALLCLLFSDLNSNRSLGPIAAIGIVFSFLAAITLLPALLVLFGRVGFWPFAPKLAAPHEHAASTAEPSPVSSAPAALADSAHPGRHAHAAHAAATAGATGLEGASALWRRVGGLIARRPRWTWLVSALLLAAACLGLLQLRANGVAQTDVVLGASNARDGQTVAAEHFPAGSGSPVIVIADQADADAVLDAVTATEGVDSASIYAGNVRPGAESQPVVVDGRVMIEAVLAVEADSLEAEDVVRSLRSDLPAVDPGALVGGPTAVDLDTNTTAQADLVKIIPIVLAVILVILILLLRAVVAPLLLIGSVILSYAATLGVSALVFDHILGFPGADASVPLFGFVFLVALGVDYNIFLMTRVREESLAIGTRPGILRGLSMTGGVITSAGIVLAATFAALAVIPILFLVQIAFIVAFGVLLDTVIVRSLLVPALSYDIGRAIWWPSKLSRSGSAAR
ncbi:MMPL family transporter [Cnuibacter physcomitrellae]|uniref:MMPL family transporter n=1 Tax=Cnuibacter physcomitrellae TaxID=1619308 RepID=UPI002175C7C3|nr:MMPL family transporter [Cnuibacter physcomitrellae]MCS5495762.1 MMPL family transporter [Cnuibacter physcomitrellae]